MFGGKYTTSYLVGKFALSVDIYEIFANNSKCQTFDLEMKVKVSKEEN